MASMDDILNDKKTYPDDTKITLASGVETTIGDLRGGFMRDRDYRQKTMDLGRERDNFAKEKSEFETAKTTAEQELRALADRTVSHLAQQRGGVQPTVDEVEEALQRDPIAKRLFEQNKKLEARVTELDERDKRHDAILQAQQKQYWTDRFQMELAALKSKDPDLDERALVQFARENEIKSLPLAYRLHSADKREADLVTKAKDEAAKEAYERGKRDAVQPLIPQRRVVSTSASELPTNFDDAADAAKRDPEILGALMGGPGA